MVIKIAHFGSRPLSREILRIMHDNPDVEVAAVVTYDSIDDKWWNSSLRDKAREFGYDLIHESDIIEYDIDYIISTLYFNKLPSSILDHPRKGCINLHQAELPRYRGSNAFSHAIMNARDDNHWEYGTTLHYMNEKLDQGDIIARRFIQIEKNDSALSLYEKVEKESISLFSSLLPKVISGEVENMRTPQTEFDGKRYFYTKDSLQNIKFIPIDRLCNPKLQKENYDIIRSLYFPPHKPAYTEIRGAKIYLTPSFEI
jgi:methionyl-tRNA formyltransferase